MLRLKKANQSMMFIGHSCEKVDVLVN